MHCVLTHPVFYGKQLTGRRSLPAGAAGDIVHTMHTSFVSVVVKDDFWLLTIFLLLKVASVFKILINAALMCFSHC